MNSTKQFALVSMVAEAARFLRYDPAEQVLYPESGASRGLELRGLLRQGVASS